MSDSIYNRYQDCKAPHGTVTADLMGGKLPPTTPDIEGPFYLPGAPVLPDGVLYPDPDLVISGRVLNAATGEGLGLAILDIWQADMKGVYDEHGMRLRGKVVVAQERPYGQYSFQTRRPGDYAISDTEFRCAHIHVKLTADGYKPLTTQLYFPDDKHNGTDHWFDPSRVIRCVDRAGRGWRFDFVLEPE